VPGLDFGAWTLIQLEGLVLTDMTFPGVEGIGMWAWARTRQCHHTRHFVLVMMSSDVADIAAVVSRNY
jgi:hypothetical protein